MEKQQEEPNYSIVSLQEHGVKIQFVPKVLQGLWLHASILSFIMASLQFINITVGFTREVLSISVTIRPCSVFLSGVDGYFSLGDQKPDVVLEGLNCFMSEAPSVMISAL